MLSLSLTAAFVILQALLVFAIAAAVHVLRAGLADPDRSRFKLFLHCTMIITSVGAYHYSLSCRDAVRGVSC